MEEPLKRRLIGATVLVSLAIIFLPMLLSHKPVARHSSKMDAIPPEPLRKFDAGLLQDATQPVPEPVSLPAKNPPEAKLAPAKSAKTQQKARQAAAVPAYIPEPKKKPPAAKPPEKPKAAAPPVVKASPSAWVIRVGSFSSKTAADKLVKKLRKNGLDTMNPIAVTVKGKRYYRVQVGPQLDKKQATKQLPRVNTIAGTKGQVVRYP